MDDAERIQQLEQRVAELEQQSAELQQQVPDGVSRRDTMKLGGAGIVGALLGGGGIAASTQNAQAVAAGATEVGSLGAPGNPIDIDAAEDIFGPGGEGSGDPVNVEALSVDADSALLGVAASGSVTLSGGVGTVDTGISATDATHYLALGVDDPNADVKLAGKLFWDDSAGTYKVEISEVDTSVGNPTVNYDILRVR